LNRRHLLQLATALAAGSMIPARGEQTSLRDLFRDPEMVAALGSRCAADLPADHDALATLAGVAGTDGIRSRLEGFSEQRRADFRDGRIVTVDGWVMARSEAALCALIARS